MEPMLFEWTIAFQFEHMQLQTYEVHV